MDRASWIDAFVMRLSRLGTQATPETLVELAECYFSCHWERDPTKMADAHCSKVRPGPDE